MPVSDHLSLLITFFPMFVVLTQDMVTFWHRFFVISLFLIVKNQVSATKLGPITSMIILSLMKSAFLQTKATLILST